ncbi:hypothetical protein ACWDZ8_01865 [Streptomyces sp. NPDC003233]|uniref:hypothetical protein n=1 Tax=Streptomyces sp. NPDC007856 TaxID=3364781 RepID=UPI0036D1CB6D
MAVLDDPAGTVPAAPHLETRTGHITAHLSRLAELCRRDAPVRLVGRRIRVRAWMIS